MDIANVSRRKIVLTRNEFGCVEAATLLCVYIHPYERVKILFFRKSVYV